MKSVQIDRPLSSSSIKGDRPLLFEKTSFDPFDHLERDQKSVQCRLKDRPF